MDVAIYLRVSSSVQVDGISLQLQRERLNAYAVAQGWTVVAEYEDAGLSGGSTDRPAFQRMIRDAKAGRFKAILVYRFDRLSRSVRDFHELTGQLDEVGVGVVSITQHIDTTSTTGRLMRNILVDFADFERLEIARKTKEAKERLAAGGRYLGWHPPFGYRKVGERANARLVVVPEEAAIVKEIFRLYCTGQYGDNVLAARFGLTGNRVRRILLNPTYAGKVAYNKRRTRSKHVSVSTIDDWIIVDGDHEAIIDEETFWRALDVRKANTHRRGAMGRSGHLFSRMVYCGLCGNMMRLAGTPCRGPAKYLTYYRCDRRHIPSDCPQRPIRHDAIESVFVRAISELVDGNEAFWETALRARHETQSEAPDERAQIHALEAQRANILQRIDNLVRALEDGELASMVRPRLAELNQERRRIEEEIRRIEREAEEAQGTSPEVTRALMKNVEQGWRLATVEEKREGVRILVSRFVVRGERVTIHWTDPHLRPTTRKLPGRWEKINL